MSVDFQLIFTNVYILREIIEYLSLSDIRTLSRVNKKLGELLEYFRHNLTEKCQDSLFDDIKQRKVLEYLTDWIKSVDKYDRYHDLTPQKLNVLRVLSLSGNELTTVPPELGRLSALHALYLHANKLTSIPPELGSLSALIVLHLGYNRITEIPPELGRLSALRGLYLWHNKLTAIPPELGNLNALEDLNLRGNKLKTIPHELEREGLLIQYFQQNYQT